MSRTILLSLFEMKLSDFAKAQSPALAVAYENKKFMPPQSAPYLQPHLMLATPRAAALGTDADDYQRGIFQVDVMGLPNTGRTPVLLAEDVAKEFKRGTRIIGTGLNAGTTIVCESVTIPQGFNEDTRYKLPVSITFYAYMNPA